MYRCGADSRPGERQRGGRGQLERWSDTENEGESGIWRRLFFSFFFAMCADARAGNDLGMARTLSRSFDLLSFSEFRAGVVDGYGCEDHLAGLTPNPCVRLHTATCDGRDFFLLDIGERLGAPPRWPHVNTRA